MAQVNSVVLSGNLTRDPELRQTNSGTAVCSLRIANNRRVKAQGEWIDRAGYYDVTVWGNQGENCARYLAKGRGVVVQGELQWREWETNQGDKRQAVDIVAREVQFLWDGKDGGQRQERMADVPADEGQSGSYGGFASNEPSDDDIPF